MSHIFVSPLSNTHIYLTAHLLVCLAPQKSTQTRPIQLDTLGTPAYIVFVTHLKTFTLFIISDLFFTRLKFILHLDNFFLNLFFPPTVFLLSFRTKHLGLCVVKGIFVLCTCELCTTGLCWRHISEQALRYYIPWVSWEWTKSGAGKNYSVISSVKYFNMVFNDSTKHSPSKLSRWHYPSLLTWCP